MYRYRLAVIASILIFPSNASASDFSAVALSAVPGILAVPLGSIVLATITAGLLTVRWRQKRVWFLVIPLTFAWLGFIVGLWLYFNNFWPVSIIVSVLLAFVARWSYQGSKSQGSADFREESP